jgi:hypothetical protein
MNCAALTMLMCEGSEFPKPSYGKPGTEIFLEYASVLEMIGDPLGLVVRNVV